MNDLFLIFFWLIYSPVNTVILWLEVIFLKSMSMCSNEATKMTVLKWVQGRGWYFDSNDASLSRSIHYNSNAVCTGVRVYRVNQEKGGQGGWLFLHRLHSRSSEFHHGNCNQIEDTSYGTWVCANRNCWVYCTTILVSCVGEHSDRNSWLLPWPSYCIWNIANPYAKHHLCLWRLLVAIWYFPWLNIIRCFQFAFQSSERRTCRLAIFIYVSKWKIILSYNQLYFPSLHTRTFINCEF